MKTQTSNPRPVYDHRLRELVRETGNIGIALNLGVPRSTAVGWRTSAPRPVITHEFCDQNDIQVRATLLGLRQQVKTLQTITRLLLMVVRLTGCKLNWERLPAGHTKKTVLRAIERAAAILPLRAALTIIGLSATRYHKWIEAEANNCPLDDLPSCPKTHPTQLLPEDLEAIHEMATSTEYRHVPTSTLSVLAQRLGKVYASATTWGRYVRERGWRRPRKRIHPVKPTEGIRAAQADELWHVDVTMIRLLDGTSAYLQAIIDNYSRRILAWRVGAKLEAAQTAALLVKAFKGRGHEGHARDDAQSLMVDGGIENINHAVNELCDQGLLKRILAQTDVHFSNSMIEAFWRALKHQWLYLNSLDNIAAVRRLVGFYIAEYNKMLPHTALNGLTPDEAYCGTGEQILAELELGKAAARETRLEKNRALSCDTCKDTWGGLASVN